MTCAVTGIEAEACEAARQRGIQHVQVLVAGITYLDAAKKPP